MHGRVSPYPQMDIPVDEPNDRNVSAPEKRFPGRGHTGKLDHVSRLAGAAVNDAERAPEPIPQALALAQVRKDILKPAAPTVRISPPPTGRGSPVADLFVVFARTWPADAGIFPKPERPRSFIANILDIFLAR